MNIIIKKSFSLLVGLLLLTLTLPEASSAQAASPQRWRLNYRPNPDMAVTWNTFLGGSGYDKSMSVIRDGHGNIYVLGSSSAAWGNPLNEFSGGFNDAFIAKLDSSGALLWHTFLGGSNDDNGRYLAVDQDGYIYISGQSQGTWGNPVQAYTGDYDAFVAKLDSSGNLIWNTFLGNLSTEENGYDIAVDETGNVYLAGTAGTYTIAFASKFDASGNLLWMLPLDGSGQDQARSVDVDDIGNVFVSGLSESTWGSPIRAFSTGSDGFVAKIGPSGNLIWNTFLGGNGTQDVLYAGVLDGSGNIYVTGSSNATWGSPIHGYIAGMDTMTVKLDTSGNLLWNTFMGGDSNEFSASIDADGLGNIYTSGGFPDNGFISRYNTSGSLLNTIPVNGGVYGISTDGSGGIYAIGTSDSTWGMPIRPFSGGLSDVFVLKLTDDVTPPTVLSVTRASANPTSAMSVNFSVTFSESVTGVDNADFGFTTTGGVSGASVTNISGSGASYTVTVNTGVGDGTIRLNVLDNDSILDASGNPLYGAFSSGEIYTIDKTNDPPTLSLSNTVTSLAENADTSSPTRVADISVSDDGFGSETLSITGTDAAYFEITGTSLYLKAGSNLDFESNPVLNVTIQVDDISVGSTPDDTGLLSINITNVNEMPTGIFLSNSTFVENQPTGTLIGALTTIDPDTIDTFNYTFCGGMDDASFSINGNILQSAASFDFETKSSYNICICTSDPGSLAYNKNFTITVIDVNETTNSAPTDLALSNASIDEYLPIGTEIGVFSTSDPDINDTFTYSLVSGSGSEDNSAFSISGKRLLAAKTFHFLAGDRYHIRVRTIDHGRLSFETAFTITIMDITIFEDVHITHWANSYIERLFDAGITGGCESEPLIYCPESNITRAQMAIFLEKGMAYPSSFTPPDVVSTFADAIGHWAEDWIEALKNDGVTSGCATGLYCPENPVTRAQMAVFLLKATHGASYSPPPATGTFSDVSTDYWAAAWIEQLAAEGITRGCAAGVYCPENAVTRAQMAVFLVKAFNLP